MNKFVVQEKSGLYYNQPPNPHSWAWCSHTPHLERAQRYATRKLAEESSVGSEHVTIIEVADE